jgi:hypothetical protein
MKRRSFLRTAIGAAGLTAATKLGHVFFDGHTFESSAAEQDTSGGAAETRIVLIGHKPDHPPGTHLYLEECRLLAGCLEQTANVKAVVSDGWPKDAAVLDGVSAIVLYSSPGADIVFKGPHADQAEKLFDQGVGLTAIHWATGIRDHKDEALADRYQKALGGIFGFGWSGLDVSESRVEQADPQHPICRGWSNFALKDEWYLNLKFLPEARPTAKVRVKDKDQVVAWTYERPGSSAGRSYGNTLGHFHENFLMKPFRQALVNGILWTAHREIPAEGAPCEIPG